MYAEVKVVCKILVYFFAYLAAVLGSSLGEIVFIMEDRIIILI